MTVTDRLIMEAGQFKVLLKELDPTQIVVLTDTNTAEYCLPLFQTDYLSERPFHHICIDTGEGSKCLETASSIYESLMASGIDRKSLLINLGGGVVTDLGGFVGATFKRGMQVINVPTTHLGMVDAALGGKNGVNFEGAKNQIGTFHLVRAVVIEGRFLNTLPEAELLSGWMETVKHALIADRDLWQGIISLNPKEAAKDKAIILRSAKIKMQIAEQDTQDTGIRQSLNFGHTVGHALEADTALLHGEAVAFGTIAEVYLSEKMCGLPSDEARAIVGYIKGLSYPIQDLSIDQDRLTQLMSYDKKNEGADIRFALISHLGRAEVGINVDTKWIHESLRFAQQQLST